MAGFPILTVTTFLPLVGALFILLIRGKEEEIARNARFVCHAALVSRDGEVATARGECAGRILRAPQGGRGFGYDPIFEVVPGTSMAEWSESEKNARSHRAHAMRALIPE